MAQIGKSACAGTTESSDAYVEVVPADKNSIEIESAVLAQFGDDIRKAAEDVLSDVGIENAAMRIVDQGALDCVIRARVEAALRRAL